MDGHRGDYNTSSMSGWSGTLHVETDADAVRDTPYRPNLRGVVIARPLPVILACVDGVAAAACSRGPADAYPRGIMASSAPLVWLRL
jgi:hypothetical protein